MLAINYTNNTPRHRTWKRSTRSNRCPVCNGLDGKCSFTYDLETPQVIHCHHQKSDRPAPGPVPSWVHLVGSGGSTSTPAPRPLKLELVEKQQLEPLAPALVDKINRRILELCPLSAAHAAYLAGEGIPSDGCGSLVEKQARWVAKKLVKEFGESVCARHPAIVLREASNVRAWWTLTQFEAGIIFPAINHEGLVLGLQLRKDKPRGKADRYRWFGREGLAGTPLTVFRAGPGAKRADLTIITEGWKKAAAAAAFFECNAISLSGVDGYKANDLIATVLKLGSTALAAAYDLDKFDKKGVQDAETRLINLCRGAFPFHQLSILNWDRTKAEKIDDAIKAGLSLEDFNFEGVKSTRRAGEIVELPGDVLATAFAQSRNQTIYTLEEARAGHRVFFEALFTSLPDGSQTNVASLTGTSKSTACDNALADAIMTDSLVGRWLLLAPNKANIAERTASNKPLGQAVAEGRAVIQIGRQPIDPFDLDSPSTGYDCGMIGAAREAGANRQITAQEICSRCPFGSTKSWQENAERWGYNLNQGRPFACEQAGGYLHSKKQASQAQVVIATKESFLNGSDEISGFDGIICDEGLLPYLLETVKIDTSKLGTWREKIMLKGIDAPGWTRLFQIIEQALDGLAEKNKPAPGQKFTRYAPVECRGTLEQAATALGFDLAGVLFDCSTYRAGALGKTEESCFEFERSYWHNAQLVIPFRGAKELLEAINDTRNPGRFERNFDGSYSLVITQVRKKLIDSLRSKTLVVLDATTPPALKMLLPDLKELKFKVRENVHILQVTSGLYTKRDLFDPKVRAKVEQAIAGFAKPGEKHLTIMPMAFEEGESAIQIPEGTVKGHWQKDDRATNAYQDYDSLTALGHQMRPIDQIEAEVVACRAYAGLPTPTASAEDQKLRLYNCSLRNGKAKGRMCKQHSDPDVQAAIEHDYASSIIQAKGRLRAALRPDTAPPARVLIFCSEPVADLEVTELTTSTELATMCPDSQTSIYHDTYMELSENEHIVRPCFTAVLTDNELTDWNLDQEWQREDPWDSPSYQELLNYLTE
jgi:hypothetical protein